MDKKKKEIRFFIDEGIYEELREKSKELDIPLSSYIKANIEKWRENARRRR